MIVVDTSVWIWFLNNRLPYAQELKRLLAAGAVAGHDLVYGELLIGDRGGRRKLLADYRQMHQVATIPHTEVIEFVDARKLHGCGISWIDAHLLASSFASRLPLWTVDRRLHAIAEELGVAYKF